MIHQDSLSESKANSLIMEVRASSTYNYPKNLLTEEEVKLCTKHFQQLRELETSEKHRNSGGELGYFVAKIKISADYWGLPFEMPGVGKERYDELKRETLPQPLRFFAEVNHDHPNAKKWLAGTVVGIFALAHIGKADSTEIETSLINKAPTVSTAIPRAEP